MKFNNNSSVTLVITSCGRFDLLRKTIHSFDKFNTYELKEVLITEDSGSNEVYNIIPEDWKKHCKIFVNNPKLGQLASIDLAYSHVSTPYIFHCEDDWMFHRYSFIEDSLTVLENEPQAISAGLRNFHHDVEPTYKINTIADIKTVKNVTYYIINSSDDNWQGFSLNPGLRRLNDYKLRAPYNRFTTAAGGESCLSKEYAGMGKISILLENSAVIHTGWEHHIDNHQERRKKRRKKIKKWLIMVLVLIVGFVAGIVFNRV